MKRTFNSNFEVTVTTPPGSTGHWPVPSGDPPLGMRIAPEFFSTSVSWAKRLPVPSGQWPDGTGGSPVPPLSTSEFGSKQWRWCGNAILFVLCSLSPFATAAADPAKADLEGRALVQDILAQRPAENSTNTGVLKIRNGKGKRSEIPVTIVTLLTTTNWQNTYTTAPTTNRKGAVLTVIHTGQQPNQYLTTSNSPFSATAFANSDFCFADLGLEFFHWPEQRLLKKELRRGESCNVLESVNPQPAPGAYSRVVSWIDIDTGGIIHADAYGPDKKLLKVFEPKKFNKVNGRWQLKEMEIRNEQTDSRTMLIFDLDVR